MRAANDFSRAQSYAAKATEAIQPPVKLSSLTVGDSLTKISKGQLESRVEEKSMLTDLKDFFAIDILKDNAADANLFTVAAFGRELAGTGVAIIGGAGIGKGASLIMKSPGASQLLGESSKIAFIIGLAVFLAGALIGYVMPIIFAIYGLMGVISWLTFVASAFFGVTLWSAAFAAPKGEEHTSQMAAKGWNMLIFIGLYPALAVGGLAAAITITSLALPLVNMTMSGMWGMTDNGVADLSQPFDALAGVIIGTVIMVLATCFLFWSVCLTSASLITNFPRTVLNMVSFSEPGLNPYENTSQGVMGSITGMVKAPMSQVTRSAVSGAMSRLSRGGRSGSSGGGA
jgi:conjugal transfer/type IV secretion protein DotA/TraY